MTDRFSSIRTCASLLGLAVVLIAPLADAARLNDLRVWHSPERTRVVMDLDQTPQFKHFYLSNPSRFVVDLPGFSLNTRAPNKLRSGELLSNIRLGTPKQGTTRMVLDLQADVTIKTQVFAPVQGYRHRLVVDIYPKPQVKSGLVKADNPSASTSTADAAKMPSKATETTKAPAPSRKTVAKPFIIAIDAGHGGEDSGARGRRSREKTIVLQVAKRLKKKIDAQAGMQAILIRKGDYFLPLRKRTEIARESAADLFISIHADGFKDRAARGSSVYALSLRGASSETARWLADKENSADLAGGVNISERDDSVAKVLLDLSMDSTQHESISFAGSVLTELRKIGKVHNSKVEKGGFVVLKSPDIPSILVETAFITNRAEERLLRSASHQEKLANAILIGVKKYLKNSTYHTAFATQ